ncbi:MAG: tyrosine-type recombinase/integrase [Lachnospiraceae bacterium]|nr:tyrosine-type recombinase/integrase [Lachnospiraceae bacterium]MCM1215696.1 tyrosine-type recombinase/integrase [Lachnospiraceae bacterium]MCM1238437.1 tyrosine-type recombinase/integrase [Lachnospiraceae bacterium]
MPLDNIDLDAHIFTSGLKNRYSRNRTVPIHSAIYGMVCDRLDMRFKSLIYHDGARSISEQRYRECFNTALRTCGIQTLHTPHDCRHTFNMLLDDAEVDRVTRYKLMGHKGQDINENVYTHKDLSQLREAVKQ